MLLRDSVIVGLVITGLAFANPVLAQLTRSEDESGGDTPSRSKQLVIPDSIGRVPANNDYDDPASDYSFARMVELRFERLIGRGSDAPARFATQAPGC